MQPKGNYRGHTRASADVFWFAYFAPYSYERHQNLLATIAASPLANVSVIGRTLEGRAMDMVSVGTGARKVWLIGRQHPGESMASWWMEGALRKLTDRADPAMARLRGLSTFFVVPMMCPDGAVRGHLRCNSAGTNLNREWGDQKKYPGYVAPSAQRSPEVLCVQDEMKETDCDIFFDVHGDEEIPDNFFAGCCGIEGWDQTHEDWFVYLSGRCKHHNTAFQIGRGYGAGGPDFLCENDPPGQACLAFAAEWVGARFNCLSVTLEMPFKDAEADPRPEQGWSPARCARLAETNLLAILDVLSHMTTDGSMDQEARKECLQIKAKNPGSWWKPTE